MLIKTVILFLAGMVLIGFVGKLLFPQAMRRATRKLPMVRAASCPRCGRYLLGKGGCDCPKKG